MIHRIKCKIKGYALGLSTKTLLYTNCWFSCCNLIGVCFISLPSSLQDVGVIFSLYYWIKSCANNWDLHSIL